MSESSSLARRVSQSSEGLSAYELVQKMQPELAKALPPHVGIDTFMRLALTELRTNPSLVRCSGESLLGALMTAARLGLEPGGPLGQFYLTPRRSKDEGWVVVPIVGYQGLRDLAYRSGFVRSLNAVIVRDGDEFTQGANESRGHWFDWVPADASSDRRVIGVLGLAELTTGGRVFRYLDLAQVLARKARGAAGDKGPWGSDFDAMVMKTGIRDVAHDLPKSTRFALATVADEQVQHYRPGDPQWEPNALPQNENGDDEVPVEVVPDAT